MSVPAARKISLNELRTMKGYTLSETAFMLGFADNALKYIEENPEAVHINVAAKLAKFYDTPTSLIKWN